MSGTSNFFGPYFETALVTVILFSAWDEPCDPGANWSKLEHMYTIQVRTNQCLDEDMLSEYMDFLTKEQGIEACLLFFNYCMGLHSKFLFLSVLYHSYKNDFDEVNKFKIAQWLCK